MMKFKEFYSFINPDLAGVSTAGCVGRTVVTSRRSPVKHVAQIKGSKCSNIWIQAGLFVLLL